MQVFEIGRKDMRERDMQSSWNHGAPLGLKKSGLSTALPVLQAWRKDKNVRENGFFFFFQVFCFGGREDDKYSYFVQIFYLNMNAMPWLQV